MAAGTPWLARLLALVFFLLIGFALPQQAAAQTPSNTFTTNGRTYTISNAAAVDEGQNAIFTVTVSPSTSFTTNFLVRYTVGTAGLTDLGSGRPTQIQFRSGDTSKNIEVPIENDAFAEGEETFTVRFSTFNNSHTAEATGTINASDAGGPPPPAPSDLTVDSVTVSSASVVEGASFTINATVTNEGDGASAATTLTYYRSADATITTDDTSIETDAIGTLAANGSSTQDASVSIADAGTYWVGACVPTDSGEANTNNNCSTGVQVVVTAAVTTVAPQITTQPTNQSVTVGGSATFTVAATGTPTPTYQWRFEGSDIAGATSASYTLSSAALTNAGDYTVVVTNTAGTVTSSAATLTVTAAAVAPQITTQPTNQSVTVGASATFTVAATGTPTPTYQWRFAGSDISGATSATYTISSTTLTDAGSYTVVVTNTASSVTSNAATLTVAGIAPQITTQPTNQSVTVGGSATFTVAATGTPTPTYQWRFAGSDISGATSASYTLSNAALTAAGSYTVVVTNSVSSVTSTAATLTVTAAAPSGPDLTVDGVTVSSTSVVAGASFTINATARNGGDAASVGRRLNYYRSADATITSGDTILAFDEIGALQPSGFSAQNASVSIATAGTYWVGACIQDQSQESDINNNCSTSVQVTVTAPAAPDLTVGSVRVSSASVVAGASFTINATVSNGGNGASAATTLTYYRSTNATITTGDTSIATDAVGALAASGSSPENASVSIATAGTYYIGACVPPVSGETNINNNCSTGVQVTVTAAPSAAAPDLTVGSVRVSSASVVAGVSFTINATVNNGGNGASAATTLTYYRSTNATITTGDTSIATDAVGALAASGSSPENASVSIATAGTYWVGACVPTVSGETNANNNCSTGVQVTVTAAPSAAAPDLTVGSVSVSSASVVEGVSFTINATVNNGGSGPSTAKTLLYKLSTDATITRDDDTISIDLVDALAANGSSPENDRVSIANAGTYWVGACITRDSTETDTDNNCSTGVQVVVTAAAVAPEITTQPTDRSVTVGDDATFTVAATGVPTPTYQWRKDGTAISGATSASYTVSSAALTNAGEYTVVVTNTAGAVTSTAATLTVTAATVAPQITTQPTNQSVTVGENATFTVAATGTPTPTYQWSFDGTEISGATSASYAISSAALTNAGDYTVVVTNTAGTVTSTAATLTVTAAAVAPQITTQPTDRSVTVGGSATFTVTATGAPTPTYQWRFEGSDIAGATSSSYTLSSAALTNAGDYTVVVTNTAGAVTSTAATLTVTPAAVAPQITTQPTDQSVTVGGSATFTVTATGAPTPTYQWRFDGSEISGATSSSYTVSSAALTNAGDYTVVVTNTAGAVTSTAATLTVTAVVNASVSIDDADVAENGGNAEFTVRLSRAVDSAVTLAVAYAAGTATLADDLGARPATVTIDRGRTEATLLVPVIDDEIVEGDEDFTVTVSEGDTPLPEGVTIGTDNTATGTIAENDTAEVTLTANTATANENGGTFSFTVNLSAAADEAVTVRWTATAESGDTATVADDLQATTNTVTFAANDNADKTFTIRPVNDNEDEDNETFTVTLAVDTQGNNPLPTGVTIGADNTATGTITDDDEAPGLTTGISIADADPVTENGAARFTVSLSQALTSVAILDVAYAPGTATNGTQPAIPEQDLGADRPTTVRIPAGRRSVVLEVPIADDGAVEGRETFTVTLSAAAEQPDAPSDTPGIGRPPAFVLLFPRATATGTITDNDAAALAEETTVSLSPLSPSAAEGGTFTFTATLSAPVSEAATVRWTARASGDNPATLEGAGSDLASGQATTGTVVFPADSAAGATQEFTIATRDDARVEGSETFTVTLAEDIDAPLPPGVTVGQDNQATATIAEPSILIEPRRIGAGAALRRHVDRFDSLTGALARSRFAGCTTRRLSASENLGRGAAATGGRFGETGWCGWLDGAWAGFDGKATGRQADIYGGVDYRGGGSDGKSDWLIGALIGYERADLEIGKATYSADYIHFGLYGGARLSERLLFDAAATYGLAAGGGPTVALGGVSASYDAWRLTVRAGLTGDIGLEYGLWNGTVRIEPRVGVLYARETLGAFTDSAGGVAGREVLELGRFSAGPRLTWDFAGDFAGRFIGGQLVVGGRAQWDFLRLDDGVGGRVSGAADLGLRLVLAPGVALGLYGNIDGIGTIGDFISYGGKVTLDLRF